MKENQKDPKATGSQQGQKQNEGVHKENESSTVKNPNAKKEEESDATGTKMPGKETRTPVAGNDKSNERSSGSDTKGRNK